MVTNRISFVDQNESSYLSNTQSQIVGYTVVKAPRGVSVPYKFPKGSEAQIKAMIGTPSAEFPDIQEAIEYNVNNSLYISAPPGVRSPLVNYYGGVYITTEACIENFYKVIDPENPNFLVEVLAGNTNSTFSATSVKEAYAAKTITIDHIDNDYFITAGISNIIVTYAAILNPAVTETVTMTISGSNLMVGALDVGDIVDNGDGTSKIVLVGNVGVSNFNLTATGAGTLDTYLGTPANYATLNVTWIMDIEDYVIQTIYQNSPCEEATVLTFKGIDLRPKIGDLLDIVNPFYNTMTFSIAVGSEYSSGDIIVSTDINAVNGFNQSLYFENVLSGKALWYIASKGYKQYTDSTVVWNFSASKTKTCTGTRIISSPLFSNATDLLATLTVGWNEAEDPLYEECYILFDNTGIPELKTIFASLRAGLHKTATFISPIIPASSDTTTAVGQIKVLRGTAPSTLGGLQYTCNQFLITDSAGYSYYTALAGTVASNLANIIDKKLGGIAPMFTNDGAGLGGQLSRVIKKQKFKFSADQLDELDTAGVNPIISDSFYGLMITSQKTAANPIFLTDWSFIGHATAFDLLKRECKQQVLIPQIGKAISPYYLQLREDQTQAILNKRLFGTTAIWTNAVAIVNDVSVNNDETKMMNKFVVKVRIKVTPFSETVEFVLNNVSQNTTI